MKKLWLFVINGLSVWCLAAATPVSRHELRRVSSTTTLWQHVNKTCLVADVCDQNVSIQHLRDMQKTMNLNANPCEDFHQFACGNWQNQLQLQPEPLMTSMMKIADNKITGNFIQLFESLLRDKKKRFVSECSILCSPEYSQVYENLIKYYNICQKSEPITLRGYFNALATQAIWHMKPYSWVSGLAQVTRYGLVDLFLQMDVKQDNSTYHIIRVQPFVSTTVKFTPKIYELIGGYTTLNNDTLHRKFVALESDLRDIMRVACANMTLDAEGECDLKQEFTLNELQHEIDEINWREFLQPQLGKILNASHIRLRIEDVASIKKIARYLNSYDSEILLVYTLARFANYLEKIPHNLMHLGVSQKNCIRHVRKLFHQPMTFLYENVYYRQERDQSEPLIRSVFEQLKQEFTHTLQHNRLELSPAAITYMQKKLDTLRLNVGNIPQNVTVQFYIDYMRDFNVSNNFYSNHLQALQHSYAKQRSLAALRPGMDDDSPWHTLSYHAPNFQDNIDSTAYYFCLNNMIILPHAYMQLPLFHHHFWPALIYGDLANTLGHELMHAFDNDFLTFDHKGNFHEGLWSTFASAKLIENIRCFEQGTKSITERIADISGTQLALNTFMRDPQFMRTNGRLFFLQFAQFFCGSTDIATHNAEDPQHDLDSVRLNYALAQVPEFASVFNCPVGSAMNPTTRCKLW